MEEHSAKDNSTVNPGGPQFDPKIEIKQVEKETPEENYKNEEELKDSNKRQRIDENSAAAVLALKEATSLNTLAEATNTGDQDGNVHSQDMNAQDALAALGQTNPNHSGQSPNMNFQLPYGYGMGGYFSSFPSGVPIETQEQYQQFLLQQQHHLRMMEQYSRENRDEDITSPKRSRSKTTPMSIPTYNPNYTGRFILVEQPNIRQRKSYKNENRYILPNPLTICAKDDTNEKLPRILDGDVTVSLVNAEGHELPLGKQNLLEAPEGGLRQQLDTNFSAHFSLKVLDTSEGSMFRLLFHVLFTVEGLGHCEERILSRPFQVYSNRKKNAKGPERPVVFDVKPKEGLGSQETEVWIKGRGFSERVMVSFGDKPAKIIETAENLITVVAPARFDILSETPVPVSVSNKYTNEMLPAEKKFTFTYYAG